MPEVLTNTLTIVGAFFSGVAITAWTIQVGHFTNEIVCLKPHKGFSGFNIVPKRFESDNPNFVEVESRWAMPARRR